MINLWNDNEAKAFLNNPLQLRGYASRLLGSRSDLVLHGGGNTSVKIKKENIFGDIEEILYVKGSGVDLTDIQPAGFAPVKLEVLNKMIALENIDDVDLLRLQRSAMTDPDSPNPSIETILHAIIPFKYVDHTHADSVLTITNNERGEELIQKIYKDQVLIVPYVKPGFILAKKVYELTRSIDWENIDAIILMNHGVFTFADDARTSYERMIHIASLAEDYLKKQGVFDSVAKAEPSENLLSLARIRRQVSVAKGDAMIARIDQSREACGFANLSDVDSIATRGSMTLDHVIRTKPIPVILRSDIEKDIADYSSKYKKYFDRNTDGNLTCLDTAPRWGVWPEHGSIAFGRSVNEADVVADIASHTMRAIQLGEAIGGWKPLPEKDIFHMEYWALQQVKIQKKESSFELQGKIALVTGAAGGIGRACAEALHEQGSIVVGFDINPEVTEIFNQQDQAGLTCDVTDDKAILEAVEFIVRSFGGLDILVTNAGIFPASQSIEEMDEETWNRSMEINLTSHQRLLKTCIPYLKHGIDPAVIFIASKNVPAPGPGASAYSVAKAGLTQLARIAAMELAPFGIRVNMVHPDAVFDTGIWTQEVLEGRAKHYGLTVAEYKTKNLLKTEVKSKDVAAMVCAMAGKTFAKTTGAQVPIDGGNERVI
ncbi:MAG: bifunctional aldolase/short-chain dehydrogenase [Proteobacteria bacterium]|nr:bifunctional aldolase/short-chain dehydrogenase [Pseudomonadota bacterium]MBU4011969.1 bifunctional aldolase/short-chain dehydrogenase [Pseudomonadota bacterium]MBU4068973.1 bifunctional aldolase/short-chain dehydrogenase [Pseudomonadota bacterium]MBU4128441.1 bifunctional aldolase/short-chain dehydrogenase [Pseudomonadota bacterium]MBU4209599.1 bifunctional aldolase/short-chain dehydrogenase [Pseudomonadota bacterium]